MKRLLKVFKNKKGFTLVELMAAVTIFTIISAVAAAAVSPIVRSAKRIEDLSEFTAVADSLSNEISGTLQEAVAAPVFSGGELTVPMTDHSVTYYVAGGLLCRRRDADAGAPVFDANFYDKKHMTLENVSVNSSDRYCTYSIALFNESGSKISEKKYAARLPLLTS